MKDLWTKKVEKKVEKHVKVSSTFHCNFCDFSCPSLSEFTMKDHVATHLAKKYFLFDDYSLYQFFDIDCLHKWCRLVSVFAPQEDGLIWVIQYNKDFIFNNYNGDEDEYIIYSIKDFMEYTKEEIEERRKAIKFIEEINETLYYRRENY